MNKIQKPMPGIPAGASEEDKARAHIESILWPHGPICPHCKSIDVYRMTPKAGSKKPGRAGLLRCKACKRQFTVTVGTIFEGSHVPLHKWLMAIRMMMASKKGMSAHQVHRMLGVTYKAAWFMCHRLRYAMNSEVIREKLSGIVEVDETYVGGKLENMHVDVRTRVGIKKKAPVLALVQRNGDVRTFPIRSSNAATLKQAILDNVDKSAKILTDKWHAYTGIGKSYEGGHHTVNHSAWQYVRGDIHTNTVESYFSLLKRGILGTFHHVSRQHLVQYCGEFAFRWNFKKASDTDRVTAMLKTVMGKRLFYGNLQTQGAF